MSHVINISVTNHVAKQTDKATYVCGNNDYEINFDFDSEWDGITTKTARFIYGTEYIDVSFTGDVCSVPIIVNTKRFKVGVYAKNVRTTTPITIGCSKSILSDEGADAIQTWEGGSY